MLKSQPDLSKLRLIVNDFGQEQFDSQILQEEGADAVELSHGCLCCGLLESFRQVLLDFAKQQDVERVIIEPSGVFVPDLVLSMFKDPSITQKLSLQPVITIINSALFIERDLTRMPFIEKQIQSGNLLVLNRTKGANPGKLESLQTRLRELNPSSKLIIDPSEKEISHLIFSEPGNATLNRIDSEVVPDHAFQTVQVTEGLEFEDKSAVGEWIVAKGERLIRAKGAVMIEGEKAMLNYTPGELKIGKCPDTISIGVGLIFESPVVKL
jgi:G3E family GTPase